MTNEQRPPAQPDVNAWLDAMRTSAAQMEQSWNEFFNQMMGTEQFAQWLGRSMDGYLAMQNAVATGMEQHLRALNIPTRSDIAQLGERIGQLEQRIEELSALLVMEEPGTKPGRSAKAGQAGQRRNGRSA